MLEFHILDPNTNTEDINSFHILNARYFKAIWFLCPRLLQFILFFFLLVIFNIFLFFVYFVFENDNKKNKELN